MSSSSLSAVAETGAGRDRPPGGEAVPDGPAWAALRACGIWELLSERGRRTYMPEGIRTWSERARGADVDATVGVLAGTEAELERTRTDGDAKAEGPGADRITIFHLSRVRQHLPELSPAEIFPYTPVLGTRAFRDAWRDWLLRKAAAVADAEQVARLTTLPAATPGVTGGLFTCGHLFLDPGDEMVVADKHWDGYDTSFGTVLGVRLAPHRLFDGAGRLDLDHLEATIGHVAARGSKVVLLLNFPHNPTGYAPSRAEVDELCRRLPALLDRVGKPLVLLFDDAYEGYVYDADSYPCSAFYAMVGLHSLCFAVKCDGITKELLFFGGRLGALTLALPEGTDAGERAGIEAEWDNKVSAVVRSIVSSPPTPVQAIAARVLGEDLEGALAERARMIEIVGRRRERLRELLDAPRARALFQADPFNGGLFALLNLRAGMAHEVAARALRDHKVGVVPLENVALGINALRLTYGSVPEAKLGRLVDALVASGGM